MRGTRVSLFSARGCPPRAKSTEFTPCHGTVPVEFTEARAASVLRGPSADRSLRTVRKLLSRKMVAGGCRTHAVLFLVGCQGAYYLHARAISLSLSTLASSLAGSPAASYSGNLGSTKINAECRWEKAHCH